MSDMRTDKLVKGSQVYSRITKKMETVTAIQKGTGDFDGMYFIEFDSDPGYVGVFGFDFEFPTGE